MTAITFLDLIKKNGVSVLLAIGLFYTNERLNKVEQELYRCYDKIATFNEVGKRYPKGIDYYAVIPKETSLKSKKHA
jgi:hypothetical protein